MKVLIHIEETIHYDSKWDIEQLEQIYVEAFSAPEHGRRELDGIRERTVGDAGYVREIVSILHLAGHEPFMTDVERHGDVQGQTWRVSIQPEENEGEAR